MELEADWDLYAVVRGSCRPVAASADPPQPFLFSNNQSYDLGLSSECFFNSNSLDELFQQFQPTRDDDNHTTHEQNQLPSTHPPPLQPKLPAAAGVSNCSFQPPTTTITTTTIATTPRSKKRRKSQLKEVRQVPAEGLISSDDTWSWRKYGQKPIKGSPYPRGYYRCSSLKGCPARKQVERNRTDPNMFIVTYTAEHNHPAPTQRNSLAGTTRNQNQKKFFRVVAPVASTQRQQQRSSSSSETGDDFFDGVNEEIENVGDGYWSSSFHT